MRNTTLPLLLLLCTALLGSSQAQEEKKLTPKQAKALFDKADKALNEAWAAAKSALSEDEFNKLKEDQRGWVEYRDYLARSPMYTGASAQDELSLDSPEYLEAAAGLHLGIGVDVAVGPLRRRALRNALPEPREGELQPTHPVSEVRRREWQRSQLDDLTDPLAVEVSA